MKKVFSNFVGLKKIKTLLLLSSLMIILIPFSSCDKDKDEDNEEQTYKGPEVSMGNGKANSFFKVTAGGTPIEIGYEMTKEALTGLPQDPTDFVKSTFVLPLDPKALELTPFDHLVINWNVHGHPPMNIFTVPHFDFHLYTITLAEQMAIAPYSPATAAKMDLLPPAGHMPASYVADEGGIPGMGKHWAERPFPSSFTHVMIYGSYNGVVNFIEPMVTLATLQAVTTITMPYAQPQLFAKTGKWYPTKYKIYMDAQTHKHIVSLSDFVKR